jgi:mycothiol synthase
MVRPVSSPSRVVVPRGLRDTDEAALCTLMARCLGRDGGLPMASEPEMVRRLYLSGDGIAWDADGGLAAAGALHRLAESQTVEFTGAVDPDRRGRGLGTELLTWAKHRGGASVVVRSDTLSEPAVRLFEQHGFRGDFEETVMRRSTSALPPDGQFEALATWSSRTAPDFYNAYAASFARRPGFPGWSFERWVDEMTGDDDFAPDASIVVYVADAPVGFVLVSGNWIEQVGVVPAATGRGIGAGLVAFALHRIAASGAEVAWLNVNVNNPRAASLYQRLGFDAVGRRGRFRHRGIAQ